MTKEEARIFRAQIEAAAAYVLETDAVNMPCVFPSWEKVLAAQKQLKQGTIINLNGQLYITEQAVLPLENQPPDGEGMLALYRPLNPKRAGTADDPIPWVYGMNCLEGQYFSYEGAVYKVAVGGTMKPCIWVPGTPGLWQWEFVKEI